MGTRKLLPWMSLELFESLGDFYPTPKTDYLKPISHKEFNEFMKCKGCKGKKDHALRDLKAKFGFKPLVKRRALVFLRKAWSLPSLTQ